MFIHFSHFWPESNRIQSFFLQSVHDTVHLHANVKIDSNQIRRRHLFNFRVHEKNHAVGFESLQFVTI